MRILITVFAAKPHFFNVVPMAWALMAAGHEVRLASQPDLMPAVGRAGLTGVPVGDDLQLSRSFQADGPSTGGAAWQRLSGVTETRPEKLTWDYVLGTFTIGCSMEYEHVAGQAMLDDLVSYARHWKPDLVLWDALTLVGPVAAKACGAAHARILFGVDYIARMWDLYRVMLAARPPEQRDDPVSDWLTGRLARHGLSLEPDEATSMMTGQWTIDPTPQWMQVPAVHPRLPVRYVTYNGPTAVPAWLREPPRRPRVCLSLGMSGRELLGGDKVSVNSGGSAGTTMADLIIGLAELDIELVATVSADQLSTLPDLPAHVRAVEFVPLNDLLPSCAAIVHHGGFGTVGNVLTHGLPSITVPAPWWDETDLGRSIERRGAGLLLDPADVKPDTLRDAVHRLLSEPSFAAGARTIQDDLRATPSPAEVVRTIESWTADHRN